MKRWWAAAAVSLAWAGCQRQPAPAPPPAACRVDLARLVRRDPRWQQLDLLDQHARQVRSQVQAPLPAPKPAALPARLAPPPPLPAPAEHPLPASVAAMEALGQQAVQARREELERRRNARLRADQRQRANLDALFDRVQRSDALDDLVRAEREVIQRYQAEITRLRLRRTRLQDRSPVPDQRERQAAELQQVEAELAALEAKRDAERAAARDAIRRKLAAALAQRNAASQEANQALAEEQRKQNELILQTLESEWQDRIDAAVEALRKAPPPPVAPDTAPADRPTGIARVAPVPPTPSPEKPASTSPQTRRARLERLLWEETRRRVLAIARQHHLRPVFSTDERELPDRTEFFARQLAGRPQES